MRMYAFRTIPGADRDVVAGIEATQQGARGLFGFRQQGVEGPTARAGRYAAFLQRDPIAPRVRRHAQGISDGVFKHGFRSIRGEQGQWSCRHLT